MKGNLDTLKSSILYQGGNSRPLEMHPQCFLGEREIKYYALVFVFILLGLVLNKSTNVRGVAFQRKHILNKSMYHVISSL